jgi:hypothetical protein
MSSAESGFKKYVLINMTYAMILAALMSQRNQEAIGTHTEHNMSFAIFAFSYNDILFVNIASFWYQP